MKKPDRKAPFPIRLLQVNKHHRMGGQYGYFDRRMGNLPLLLAGEVQRVLFLGIGTGGTLGCVGNYPIEHVDAVEIIPEGIMLYIQNNDRPGVIGNIGTILGQNGINIARMHFGREAKGGNAISVVSVDAEVSGELVRRIKELPNINSVKLIKL